MGGKQREERQGERQGERRRREGEKRGRICRPPPCRRREQSQERHEARESEAKTEAEEDKEGNEEEEDKDGENPRGATVEFICVGGRAHPRRKTRTSRDSPQNMRTCCYGESMETSCITTMGCTRKGESETTLYGSVVGAGSLRSQQAGTPRPLDW